MGLNLAEIQQKLDRLIQNMSEQNRRAYQIFYDPNPQDVTLPQLDENGNLVNVTIPNRAKIKAEVDNFIAGARGTFVTKDIKSFFVEGDGDKFYPVVFDPPWRVPVNLKIFRRDVHQDGTWYGSMFFEVEFFLSECGHGSDFTRLLVNTHSQKLFVAKYLNLGLKGRFVVWLRGNTHYQYISSHDFENVDFSAQEKSFPGPNCGGDVTLSILTETDIPDELKNNYVFGGE